jgi:hypothetical protein
MARILSAGGNNQTMHDNALRIWRTVLALDLPEDSPHRHGAGALSYAMNLNDQAWLKLNRRTVKLSPRIEAPDHVARRAPQHPQAQEARAIPARLPPLYDGAVPSELAQYRGAQIVRQASPRGVCQHPGQ